MKETIVAQATPIGKGGLVFAVSQDHLSNSVQELLGNAPNLELPTMYLLRTLMVLF